jgi:hypothetical protein
MKKRWFAVLPLLVVLDALTSATGYRPSHQDTSPGGAPVHMVITAEARHGNQVPVIRREDVQSYQERERAQVSDWLRLTGEHAGLQLFLLIDDSADTSLGSQIAELQRFISSQPASTATGLGYMHNGTVEIAQDLTKDHAAAAKAVRLPIGNGGAYGSTYLSIVDLIKRWPEGEVRREVVVISDGIDPYGGTGPMNPYVDSAMEEAQRAGIIVYAIYATGRDYYGSWIRTWGQNHLAQLAEESGGEAYFLGYDTPVSFQPYFEQINRRLANQYLLTFVARPGKKPGLHPIRVRTEVPNAALISATRVYIPAGP